MSTCTDTIVDATIASAIGAGGMAGPTSAPCDRTDESSAAAIVIASGAGEIARSTGGINAGTAASSVPTNVSDNDLTGSCGSAGVLSRPTIHIDRRSIAVGATTMTMRGGAVARIGGTADIAECAGDVERAAGEAAMSTDAPSALASSSRAATNDVVCPQNENSSATVRSATLTR